MMKNLLIFFAFIFLLMACNNSGSNKENTKSRADSLMDEVMAGHDAGMAKMNKVSEAQKKVQQTIDSISKLSENIKKSLAPYKANLDSILDRLKYAGYAMNKWMDEFDMDSAKENLEKRIEYLESEKSKISKVKDAMMNSLQKADSILRRKL